MYIYNIIIFIHTSYVCKYIYIHISGIFSCIYADMAYWEGNIGYLECKGYTQMILQFPPAKNLQFNRINRIIVNQITIKGKFLKFTICGISVLFPEYPPWHMEMTQNSWCQMCSGFLLLFLFGIVWATPILGWDSRYQMSLLWLP